jgi:hypothetical protein
MKLEVKPELVSDFMELFHSVKRDTGSAYGLRQVELLQSIDSAYVFFTYGVWENETYLKDYLFSELFRHTWKKTRALLSNKPQAWNLKLIEHVASAHF